MLIQFIIIIMTFPSKVYIFLHENIFTKKNMLSHYVSLKLNNIEKKIIIIIQYE